MVLYFIIPYYIILYYIILSVILYYTILYYILLYYITLYLSVAIRAQTRTQAPSCLFELVEMASSTDSQAKVIELLTNSNELLEKVQSTMADVARCSQLAVDKASHIEIRQEDQRRAEGIVVSYWLGIEQGANGKTKFDEPNYNEIAELLPFMPSTRRKMLAVADKLGKREQLEKRLPSGPEGLASLFKIVVPIGTNYEPIEPIPEMGSIEFEQLYRRIPGKHMAFIEYCLESELLRGRSENSILYSII